MNTPDGRRRLFFVVSSLLIVSILVEQYALQPFFPFLSRLGGIRPMVVFLDIPLPLPAPIDLLPTGLLFSFLYWAVLAPNLSHGEEPVKTAFRKKLNAFFAGALAFLASLATGGIIFYLLEGHLSRQVRNGIDSFGIQADISLPWPADGAIRLHGSMIMLASGYFGMRIWLRMVLGKKPVVAEPQPVVQVAQSATFEAAFPNRQVPANATAGHVTRIPPEPIRRKDLESAIAAQMGKRITMQIPEPVLFGKGDPPSPPPRGHMQPCVVDVEMLQPVVLQEH